MNIHSVCTALADSKIEYKENFDLSKKSTFRIGGNCTLAIFPKSKEEMRTAVQEVKKAKSKFIVIGGASNVLFSDNGYDGIIIFTSQIKQIYVNSESIYAECGAKMTAVSKTACENSLAGLEFAYGIPGSCGGGVFMNAGAYGGEISDVLVFSEYYDAKNDEFGKLYGEDNEFSYRKSIYSSKNNFIIVGAEFKLMHGNKEEIELKMSDNMHSRREKQPLEYPNAGSTFKRPQNMIAAQMIDKCGLKGLSVGGAEVSEKHAGFVVNKGNATSKDVKELISLVKNEVYKKYNVILEEEIIFID